MSNKLDIEATVLDNRLAGERTIAMELHCPGIAENISPGQFIMMGIPQKFLRRPFSVAGVNGNRILLLIRVVGEGTQIISSMRRNQKLKILGPLGNPFPKIPGRKILVAGGIGIAPLLFLATRTDNRDIVYGEKSAEFVLNEMYIPPDTKIATDDGSVGFCGNVCELLTELEPAPIFACGPTPMLKKLTEISRQWNVQAFFSMESRMACGFGACNGCVIHTIDGYKKVCSDGPIFPAQMLKEF